MYDSLNILLFLQSIFAILMFDPLCVSIFNPDKRAIRIWTGLAACFGVSKVARKARVDSGPKRESRVQLLLPAVGESASGRE